ncbi:hypothetical protein LWI28_016309 [Acer negundo]|uniref:Uncharacterized protein n=1 Tax=Acer negundo TaxID=4023 RepID=A0AAD5NFP8_ACENE|nr:hypothetical protein LWI28_016309 [Acer negundo]
MSWFFIIFFLSFTVSNLEAIPADQKKPPSTFVVGTVYCDTCFQENFSKSSHFISGASVAVECRDGTSKPSFQQEVKTDEHGEFKIPLPFSVSKHVKKIKRCSVKLIKSSEPNCAVASTATSSSLHLKSRKEGTHIFSAGFFTFKPLNQPNLCNQKPSLENSKAIDNPSFPPPIQDPTTPDLPGIPLLPKLPPLPQLPPLPPLPGLPYLPPMPGKTIQTKPEQLFRLTQLSDQKVSHPHSFFPPNPFLPPPILPPNPLQPPSPLIPLPPVPGLTPSPLIPLPPAPRLTPTPSPLIPLPPVPGLTPSPPPTFPFPPLPPFPFPPLPPLIPGIPPATSSP